MNNQELDNLAYQAYVADLRAEGDPLIAKSFDRLDERYQKRYRAIAQALMPQNEATTTTQEAEMIEALRNLPLSIQITPRLHGYAYQVLDKNGTRPTFAEAVARAIVLLTSYLVGAGYSALEYSDLKEQYGNPDNRNN